MSKITLAPDVSGSAVYTIASPAGSTDRTLTLPDTSGTLLSNSGTQEANFSALAVAGNNISAQNSLGFRNRLINSDMRIDQRRNGASVTINSAANTYVVDRWRGNANGGGAFSLQRSTVAPTGFTNSLLATVTTADASVVPGDFYHVRQTIEGFNFSDLSFGSASAQTITLSFWTRNSLTGTFTALLRNNDGGRGYVAPYTVNAANTWEYKTITIPGDTTGTWATDNSGSCIVNFGLGTGSTQTPNVWLATANESVTGMTQWISTLGATFYVTGVQLEAGSVATPFERRDYGREFVLCQRYYEVLPAWADTRNIVNTSNSYPFNTQLQFKVTKRANPTMNAVGANSAFSSLSFSAISVEGCIFGATNGSTGAATTSYIYVTSGFNASAEF